ncbi:hypothetical protein ABBQ38_008504 [Trebouxia sp. C0009 RCD-2024]
MAKDGQVYFQQLAITDATSACAAAAALKENYGHLDVLGIDFSFVLYLLSLRLGMQPISHLSSNPSIAFDVQAATFDWMRFSNSAGVAGRQLVGHTA